MQKPNMAICSDRIMNNQTEWTSVYKDESQMQENYTKKIGKATAWSSITEILAKLISPIVNMVLARLLAPEAFGAVATITMITSFAEIFADAGFQKYIVQHEFESREELDKSTTIAFWTNLVVSVIILGVIVAFRHQLADFAGNSSLGNALGVASITIVIIAFSSIQAARYKRDFDFKTLFFARIGTSLIPLVVTIPLALRLRNFWALIIGTVASHLFNAVVLTVKSKWKPDFFYRFSMLKKMLSFSMWTLLESISIWLTAYIDIFIVGNYLNDYYLGLYKTSMTTVNTYMAIITSAITPVLFSALSRSQNDDEGFRKTFYTFQKYTAVLILPMGIGLFLYRDLVTTILLGKAWAQASTFVGLWGLTSAFAIIFSHFSSEVFRSKGKPKTSLILQLFHLCFLVPVLLVSIRYGFEVLYISRSLIRFQLIITVLAVMHIRYKFKIQNVFINIFPMFLCSAAMGAVGYTLQQINDTVLWQILSILVCIIVYFGFLFLLFPRFRTEILSIPAVTKILRRISKKP